jgi:hypothetical protein
MGVGAHFSQSGGGAGLLRWGEIGGEKALDLVLDRCFLLLLPTILEEKHETINWV